VISDSDNYKWSSTSYPVRRHKFRTILNSCPTSLILTLGNWAFIHGQNSTKTGAK